MQKLKPPSQGGSEAHYLNTFLKVRAKVMQKEEAHQDLYRIKAQRKFIIEKKWNLQLPLAGTMYGDQFYLTQEKLQRL